MLMILHIGLLMAFYFNQYIDCIDISPDSLDYLRDMPMVKRYAYRRAYAAASSPSKIRADPRVSAESSYVLIPLALAMSPAMPS